MVGNSKFYSNKTYDFHELANLFPLMKIFESAEFLNFNPFDSKLKYPLVNNENLDSKIFKTILNLIYENRDKIERAYKDNNIFGLAFKKDGTLHISRDDSSFLSNSNLAKLLGINIDALGNYIKDLDGEDFNFGHHHQSNLRNIRNTLSEIFDFPTLKGAKAIVRSLFDNYIDLRYTGEEHYVVKFLTFIDDYTSGVILSEVSVSEKLGYNEMYLRDFKKQDKGKYDKYFRFVISIFNIDPIEFNFKDPDRFDDFKEEIQLLIYNQMVRNKMITDTDTKKMQYDAIISALYALTLFRYRDSVNLPRYITNGNPLALYTLKQLSEVVSPEGCQGLITDQLRTGRRSVQLGKIITELNRGIGIGIEECQVAKNAIQEYLKQERLDAQDFGNIFHDIFERFTIEYIVSKGGKCTYEAKVNYPESNHKVDNIILRDQAFIENVEDHQNIVNIPKGIKLVTVDYTFIIMKNYEE